MKRINKFALFILGALSFASCSDINDIEVRATELQVNR